MASPETGASVVSMIRRTLLSLVVATVVLYLGLAGVTYWVWTGQNTNREALCALRVNQEQSVAASEMFQADVLADPDKAVKGITPQQIQAGIDRDKRTIAALSDLSC